MLLTPNRAHILTFILYKTILWDLENAESEKIDRWNTNSRPFAQQCIIPMEQNYEKIYIQSNFQKSGTKT